MSQKDWNPYLGASQNLGPPFPARKNHLYLCGCSSEKNWILEESIFASEIWPRIASKSDLKAANFETTYPGLSGFSRLPPRKLRNHSTPFPELRIRRYALFVCQCLPRFDAGVPQGPIYTTKRSMIIHLTGIYIFFMYM